MPSHRKRMALTLPDPVSEALSTLAAAVGKPVATVAVELLTEMAPQMLDLAKIARAQKAGNQAAAKRAVQHMLGDALAEVMSTQQPELFGKPKKARG